jgi:hypothetical protein
VEDLPVITSHLVKYFEEIGWFDPFPNKSAAEADEAF